MGAQVKGAATTIAHHVVMASIRVRQLKVESVSHCHFRHNSNLCKEVECAVHSSYIHIRIGLLCATENLIHAHMPLTLCDY